MTHKLAGRNRLFRAGLGMLLLGATLGFTGYVSAPAAAAGNDHQITICHATGSNLYSTPNPAKWQITAPNGHGLDPDDIIPPFAAGSQGGNSWAAYPGLNWVVGEAIWLRGCNATVPAAGSVSLDKVTAGDGQPVGTTPFAFSVVCNAGAPYLPTITPDSAATVVGTRLASGSSCTITETDAVGAASTSFAVDGGSEVPGSSVVVAFTSDTQTISVVVTNTYQCPQGQTPNGQGGCGTGTTVPTTVPPTTVPPTTVPPTTVPPTTVPTTVVPTTVVPTTVVPLVIPAVVVPEQTGRVQVEGLLLTAPAAPAAAATVAAAQLPQTGSNAMPLVRFGFGLIILGFGAMLLGRREQTRTA